MPITIEPVGSLSDLAELIWLYRTLRELEPEAAPDPIRLSSTRAGMHLLARYKGRPGAVAALTVVETTGDAAVHRRYGLKFPAGARVARYASTAVLPAYRRTNVFVRLIEEARRLFISRRNIRYTWFYSGAERASRSRPMPVAGYRPPGTVAQTNRSCRVLVRDEWSDESEDGIPDFVDFASLRGVEAVCTQAG